MKDFIQRKAAVCLQALMLGLLSVGVSSAPAQAQGVCDRTQQVQKEILRKTPAESCRDVTSGHLEGIEVLNLSFSKIRTLKEDDFEGIINLKTLYLQGNRLSTLPATVFAGVNQLGLLVLRENRLNALPPGVFTGLGILRKLRLQGNELTSLPPGVFAGLVTLKDLYLGDNQLDTLPAGVFAGLGSLNQLKLEGNSVESFDLVVEFERTGTGQTEALGADSPSAEVRLTLREGAPGDATIPLRADGARLSHNRVVLSAGSTQSEVVTVTRSGWREAAVAISESPLSRPDECRQEHRPCYQGFQIIAGPDFTLEAGPILSLASTQVEVEERGAVEIVVNSTLRPVSTVTVNYHISRDNDEHTADADDDDYGSVGVVTIAPGATAGVIRIPITDDETAEPANETFTVSLTTSGDDGDYGVGSQAVATVTIWEGVCGRTRQVRDEIVRETYKRNCKNVTSRDLSGITRLNLSDRGISSLKENDFTRLVNLWELHLDNNLLTSLSAGVFSNLDDLRRLYLDNNLLTTLPAEVFEGLGNLRELSLENNQLTLLPAGVFEGLSGLGELSLENNQLTSLPAGVFEGLSGLGELSLENNQLTSLPAGVFTGLNNLGLLRLDNNRLATLPAGVFAGSGYFWGLRLRLDNNRLTTLPAEVFAGADNLAWLRLDNNLLTTLPAGVFANLDYLWELRLDNNRLTSLPPGVFEDISPGMLRLDNNRLTTLPPGVFAGFNDLESLYLHNNRLTTLPEGVFAGLNDLESLYLHNNRLATLPAGVFAGLNDLESLYLHNNRLVTLPENAFSDLGNLPSLYLANNRLTALPAGIFSGLYKLRGVYLEDNLGLPFDLTVEFQLEDPPNVTALSAEFRLALREGAPTDITVPLAVQGGALSADQAILSTGSTQSDVITVTRNPGVEVIVVALNPVYQSLCHYLKCDILDVGDIYINAGLPLILEGAPSLGLSFADALVKVKEGETAELALRWPRKFSSPVTVGYRIGKDNSRYTADADDQDYRMSGSTGTVVISPGAAAAAIRIPITDDEDVEPTNEWFTVSLTIPDANAGYALGSLSTSLVVIQEGVCDRTPTIRDLIVNRFSLTEEHVQGCADITEDLLRRFSCLELGFSGISELKKNDFLEFSAIRGLHLDNNQLTTLPEGVFAGLRDLRFLDIFKGHDNLRGLFRSSFSRILERFSPLLLNRNSHSFKCCSNVFLFIPLNLFSLVLA